MKVNFKRSGLRMLRVAVSVVIFSLITFYFLDFAELTGYHSWLERIQLVPALLSGSVVIVVSLLALTLLFGRVYCSSICPMGIFQDIVDWIAKKMNRKKKYGYRPEYKWVRWGVLGAAVIAWLAGFTFLAGLVEPYSAYGRMAANVFSPIYMALNNLLAWIFTSFGNYTFYYVEVSIRALAAFAVALLTLAVVAHFAFHWGRTYCNTVCPVGTFLGLLSRFSLFKLHIDTDKCNNCGLCSLKCKGYCIDAKNHKIDYSRCVTCYDCIDNCRHQAISYTLPKKGKPGSAVADKNKNAGEENITAGQVTGREETGGAPMQQSAVPSVHAPATAPRDDSRRRFILTSVATAAAIPMLLAEDQSSFFIQNAKAYKRKTPLSPPGSVSHAHFLQHCTSCHLCVTKCPSHVLKPALLEYGLGGIIQPMMDFEKGFCNFDCTVCCDVCPNGAIKPLTVEQKHKTQMGRVVFIEENCIVARKNTSCGACSEHCPTQAVAMVPYKDGLTIPKVDPEICVGCGGCEYVCPTLPYKAIYIEGNAVQQEAKSFVEEKKEEVVIDDFGF